jgi:four helix bundle protein
MGNFKELKVWQVSKGLAVDIYKLTESVPFKHDFGLSDQIRRSSVSIPSNIAEGDGLETDRQSIRHLFIARGSTAELITQLAISLEIGYLQADKYNELERECEDISAMITGLIRHRRKKLL